MALVRPESTWEPEFRCDGIGAARGAVRQTGDTYAEVFTAAEGYHGARSGPVAAGCERPLEAAVGPLRGQSCDVQSWSTHPPTPSVSSIFGLWRLALICHADRMQVIMMSSLCVLSKYPRLGRPSRLFACSNDVAGVARCQVLILPGSSSIPQCMFPGVWIFPRENHAISESNVRAGSVSILGQL
jgi:hypothetical protein